MLIKMGENMAEPSFSSTLYDCATECALRRQNGRCRETFGGSMCAYCQLYLPQYIDADPRHIKLFMLGAQSRADAIRRSGSGAKWALLIVIAIIAYFGHAHWKMERKRDAIAESYRVEREMQRAQPQAQSKAPSPAPVKDERTDIVLALQKVAKDLDAGRDVNGDGLSNCIDAACLFYKYFPDKSNVAIVVNRNDATEMYHMFNSVMVDGVWRTIEPQAIWGNKKSYWMKDIWGDSYDYTFNKVVTGEYKKFAR